ncbi:adenylate/guanylate cyclase domain-containing protein [Herbidospora sp. NBRC 101105]|uniref:adenylate/guanylate cyclase domain-containing protein n=1 Tax=Herbidospora sp. NBRC 101105 TaxID=3032195 RepID=UPI0024A33C04|nr:adenylate/guanylate cyclase domain-containing protein [Herbidospora sp. NBRC 101105]GLX95375.1 guanylate cyclase [Herbidospora sp. NBRC 101105]
MQGSRPARRHIVVLFIDLSGSTELAERLDPELLMQILERYYAGCREAIFANGGVIEKYIGDAIMAVFGIPLSREDDALRAVLAAHGAMRSVYELADQLERTVGVRIGAHVGVAFGEVMVVGHTGTDVRVIGDTVNTAARIQSAAKEGEILLGDDVARLVRQHAVMEEVPPLTLKGKKDPVRAWRLIDVEPDRAGDAGADTVPLIGRDEELAQLTRLHERVIRERLCGMATLLGVPGIGKSRLVREFLHRLPPGVRVLTGRCPSYGIGATYRPIAEMLEDVNGDWPAVAAAVGPEGERTLRALAGNGQTPGVAEIARAVRSFLEVMADNRPLVVVLDNLQWAEPTLLELVDDCVAWLTDVPVLFVCVARPEVYELRPGWGGGMACGMSLELGPLSGADVARLVQELCAERVEVMAHADEALHWRVAASSDGNPLFAELMLETLTEGDGSLPPTITALLGARLDRLGGDEREVLERAATIGQIFTLGQVEMLGADLSWGTPSGPVRSLQRDRLVRRGSQPGAFEFTQTLTRETVYSLTSKEQRADWHRRLADWLGEQEAADDTPFRSWTSGDISRHLLAACRFTREVRPFDPLLDELTDRAATALIRDGGEALHRRDLPAAIALLEHGREILPKGREEHRRLAILISDAELARGEAGKAAAALDAAEEMLPGDPRTALTCTIQREMLGLRTGRGTDPEALRDRLEQDDDLSWCRFHQLEAWTHIDAGRFGAADQALRDGVARARAMGDRYEEDRLLGGLCELVQWSPTPVGEGLALCADLLERFVGDRALLVPVLLTKARLLGLSGGLAEARETLDTAAHYVDELDLGLPAIAVTQVRGLVESLAGDHEKARALFRDAAAALHAAGHGGAAATLEIYAARETLRLGDPGLAARELDRREGPRQLRGEVTALALRAAVAARSADHSEALRLADRAAELVAATDDLCLRGDVLVEVAQVRRAAGRDPSGALRDALDAYDAKGASLLAHRTRDLLGDL